jgi:hypothetical protein
LLIWVENIKKLREALRGAMVLGRVVIDLPRTGTRAEVPKPQPRSGRK